MLSMIDILRLLRNGCLRQGLEIMLTSFGGRDEAHRLQVKARLQGLAIHDEVLMPDTSVGEYGAVRLAF